jgi:predicted transcriptional regulator
MAMTLRLTDEESNALRAYAEATGQSMQGVARLAIHEYVTERRQNRRAVLKRIAEEDADLLDLLAK